MIHSPATGNGENECLAPFFEDLIPAQGANVAAVLATNLLLGIGYLIAA
jgi:hypothetical protein